MSSQIIDVVKEGTVCAKPPLKSTPTPVYPFQIVSMDVFFSEYKGKRRSFLVTVDHYSDYIEVDILKDLSASCLVNSCQINFARHGVPQMVISDNGTYFVNHEMKQMAKSWNSQHFTSAPYHQQANGKAKAAVKFVKRLIQIAEETALEKYTKQNRQQPKTGSPVYVQLHPDANKKWTPATVSQKHNDRSYVVDVAGSPYCRDLVYIKPREEPTSRSIISNNDSHPAKDIKPDNNNNQTTAVETDLTTNTSERSPYTSSKESRSNNAQDESFQVLGLKKEDVMRLQCHRGGACAFVKVSDLELAQKVVDEHDEKHEVELEGKKYKLRITLEDGSVEVKVHDLPKNVSEEKMQCRSHEKRHRYRSERTHPGGTAIALKEHNTSLTSREV
ncbi:uncharacterized protein LOC131428992 [Malaya genurostris]|uniref:uncharacterized protein LOC131428992 n=1 Tax=Malaya genurostris TaxID=325434 RepID=UPI0026F3E801|nr:uncharacterized protein LOC131428992 [Malaya genurostris]